MGAILIRQDETLDASGNVTLKGVYAVSLDLLLHDGAALMSLPTIEVRALPARFRAYEAIVGWPMLRAARLIADGPARSFSLEHASS